MIQNDRRSYVLPVFRRMVKAIGDHANPKATAYRYEVIEFWPDGRFIRRPAVFIADTQMRADGDRLYEMQWAGGWELVSMDEFYVNKMAWDKLRTGLSLPYVDELGEVCTSSQAL